MSQPPQKLISNNLLSNVNPPTELPNFISTQIPAVSSTIENQNLNNVEGESSKESNVNEQTTENFLTTSFSAAVPPQKNTAMYIQENPQTIPNERTPLNTNSVASALEPITQGGSNILGWMRDAVEGSSGILYKVAEKAKNSVDTIVTTLDPQMKEYIYSGGDLDVLVASDKDDKVRPVREAFQNIFGKATITGIPAQCKTVAAQPVGFNNAEKAARERIECVRNSVGPGAGLPIVAIENFIVELYPNEWFAADFILLSDLQYNIEFKSISQMTPLPESIITTIKADTQENYEFKESGFSVTIGQIMANNLRVKHTEWQKAYTTISRAEMILNAVKTIASIYKQNIKIE